MTMVDHTPQYGLWAQLTDGSTGLVPASHIAWEELPGEIATRITVDFPDIELEQGWLSTLIEIDSPVAVMGSDAPAEPMEEVARGTVWDIDPPDGEAGTFAVTIYDPIQSLHHTEFDAWHASGQTCGQLIRSLADEWSIPLGTLDPALDTYTFGVQAIQGKTLASAIQEWLREAYLHGMARLVMRSTLGKLDIVPPGGNDPVYWIRKGESSLGLSRHISRSNLVTRVVAVGQAEDDAASPVIGILDGDISRGIWQKIVRISTHQTVEEVRSTAQQVLVDTGKLTDNRTISALDRPRMRKFDKVRITDASIDSYCVVEGISHNGDSQTMNITLGNLVDEPLEGTWTLKDANAIPKLSSAKGKLSAKVAGSSLAEAINPWIGVPYLFGGNTKAGVDCSGFTLAVFATLGVSLPRTAQAQYNATSRVSEPEVGDLVFFSHTYDAGSDFITHVGIYVGSDQMVSAAEPRVGRQSLNTAFWKSHFAGYGRVG